MKNLMQFSIRYEVLHFKSSNHAPNREPGKPMAQMTFHNGHRVSDPKTVMESVSMAKAVGFSYAYGWNGFYESVLGIRAVKGEGRIVRNRAWAWIFVLTVCSLLPQAACLTIITDNLNLLIGCMCTTLSMALATAKIFTLHRKRIVIGGIYDTMENDWKTMKTDGERIIMSEVAAISRSMSIISVFMCNILFVSHAFAQFWSIKKHGRDHWGGDPRVEFGFILPSYFPFDISYPIVWILLWTGQLASSILSIIAYSGPDCLASLAVLHLCGQLRIVSNSLKNLVDETTVRNPQEFWHRLNGIIARHEQLIRFGFVIRNTFSAILLVKMVAVTMIFCFQVYAVFTNVMDRDGAPVSPLDMIFSMIYATYTGLHLFAYCYSGDRLIVESSKVSDDFYESAWYDLAPKEARALLFVCHRTKTPLELTAGDFCTFNLVLFNSIMKNSMGYLSMLTAMKDRLVE